MSINKRLFFPKSVAALDPDLNLYLDAYDSNSYPGSGSDWLDLTDNSNDASGTNISSADWNSSGYFTLNGTNEFFTISNDSSVDITSSGFTLIAWIYHTDGNQNHLIDKGTSPSRTRGYNLQINANQLDLRIHATGSTSATIKILGTTNLTQNTWNHVSFTVDGLSSSATGKSYISGVLEGTHSGRNMSGYTNSNDLLIGRAPYGTADGFDGRVGSVKIFQKVLSASELVADFNDTKSTYGL